MPPELQGREEAGQEAWGGAAVCGLVLLLSPGAALSVPMERVYHRNPRPPGRALSRAVEPRACV